MNVAREVRVLLVEDSRSQRETLAWVIRNAPGLTLVGEAENGAQAVDMVAQLAPDVVLMDCHMPVMDGIAATREIMSRYPTPIIVTSATYETTDVHPGMEALREGALAIAPKPLDPTSDDFDKMAEELRLTLRLLADVKVARLNSAGSPTESPIPPLPRPSLPVYRPRRDVQIIVIGASTGGPPVLLDILRRIRPELDVPVVLVQHICAGFTAGFAGWLSRSAGLPVEIARAGAPAKPGCVYVAPENCHLGMNASARFVLDEGPPEDGFRPSVSHLFRSTAAAFGPNALAILLTGMGQDGAEGMSCIAREGGATVVQDRQSSVVFGMPNAAIQRGAAQRILPPRDIARFVLTQLAARRVTS